MTSLPRLLLITPPSGAVGLSGVEAAVRTGVALGVLLREPGASPEALLDPHGRLGALRTAARAAGLPVWLSCDPAFLTQAQGCRRAQDAGIRGLQLRGDPPPELEAEARRLWPHGVFGRSVHGAPTPNARWDYSVFAPVYAPGTASDHIKQPAGLGRLKAWCDGGSAVFALGGITPESAPACLAAGAWGLAGISTFLGSTDAVADTLRALGAALAQYPAHRHVRPPQS